MMSNFANDPSVLIATGSLMQREKTKGEKNCGSLSPQEF